MRDPQAIRALHDEVVASFPELDVLVNNAGVMRKINLQTFGTDLEDIAQEIDINLTGSIRMVMQFLPHLRAQPSAAIVNVSSGLAFNPYPISPIYGATKAGTHSFTQSLRVQLKNTNIKVFEVAPPAVDTPLSGPFAEDLKGTAAHERDEARGRDAERARERSAGDSRGVREGAVDLEPFRGTRGLWARRSRLYGDADRHPLGIVFGEHQFERQDGG